MSTPLIRHYPVVVAGASYSGLAAASMLGGRALLIDQHEVGAIQHSACALPLSFIDRFDVRDAVLQTYPSAIVHTSYGDTTFDLPSPYAIFDHQALCQSIFDRSESDFLHARIRSFDGRVLRTTAGDVSADLFIDATGWRGALATSIRPELYDATRISVGIEADIEGRDEGIHFYSNSKVVRAGYAWVFPAGETLRIGVLSYRPGSDLKSALATFLEELGYSGKACRGGRIPWFSRPGVIDNVMLAGDAAGQCLPVTAEGIRFALHFGEMAGRLASRIVDGEMSRAEGLRLYGQAIRRHRRRVASLRTIQHLMMRSPEIITHAWVRFLSMRMIKGRFLSAYGQVSA